MNLYKALNSKVSWTGSIVILFAVVIVVIWSLNKGMLFSTEAYYIFQTLPDMEVIGTSYWHIIYSPFIFDNFIFTKFLLVILVGTSSYFMGNITAKYLKIPISPVLIGMWCLTTQFALLSPVGYFPNYSNINPLIFNSIIIFLSLFLIYKKRIFLIILGFFFASLTFVMITNNLFLLPLLVFIYFSEKDRFWINCGWIFLGGVLLILVYFIFLQSPFQFYNGIIDAIDYLKYDKTHGASGMKIWHYHLIRDFFIPGVLLIIGLSKLFRLQIVKFIILGISLAYLVYLLYEGVTHKFSIFPTLIFYFLAGWLVINSLKHKSYHNLKVWFCIMLISLPYFASFGTDVDFYIRSSVYFPFILIGCLYLGLNMNTVKGEIVTFTFLSVTFIAIATFFSYPFRPSWEGYKLIEQTEKFERDGITIYLDKNRLDNLKEVYPYLEKEKKVFVSFQRLWGYVLNSGARPPYLYYRFSEYSIEYIKENDIPLTELIFLEDKERPFDHHLLDRLIDENFKFNKTELSNFNIYKIEKLTINTNGK